MSIEYGACYKNVKEASLENVSLEMSKFASSIEAGCDDDTFDLMYQKLHKYKVYGLLQKLIENDELSYTQLFLIAVDKKNIETVVTLFSTSFDLSALKKMVDSNNFSAIEDIFIKVLGDEVKSFVEDKGYLISVMADNELLVVHNRSLSDEDFNKLAQKVYVYKFAEHPESPIFHLGFSCYNDFEDETGLFVMALNTRHNRKIVSDCYSDK